MKELNRKTFITIFSLLSLFIVSILVIFNIQNYKREYESIKRNLNIIDNNKHDRVYDDKITEHKPRELDSMMIIDYEVYTIKINNNNIEKITSHGNASQDFDVQKIAQNILTNNNKDTIKIGNLYTNKYSYNYKFNNYIVILNAKTINEKLIKLLIESIIILISLETIIYFITKKITAWIVKPAEDALKKQKDFIADASHELKTPLAVIIASSDELESNKHNNKYIENIKFESERMSTLISSMLDLSKLEEGISKSTYKEENISKIVEKICLTFEALAFEHGIKILTDIEEKIYLKCNKEEIEKLISINIDNAIKHSYKNSIIKVNMYKDKNNINIEVINSGEPIKKGDEDKIFERFYRSDKSRSRKENRYGLGLAIAKKIVINYNGTIKASSNDGKTTFKIILKKKDIKK